MISQTWKSAKQILQPLTTLVYRFVLVSAVVLVVLSIFGKILLNTNTVSIADSALEDKARTIKRHEEMLKSPDQKTRKFVLLERQVLCLSVGELCHEDPYATTDRDVSKSFIGKGIGVAMFPYTNMPSSGLTSMENLASRAGLVPQVYAAQGFGFGGLAPYSYLWQQLRNVVFIILTLIMLFSGFAVMFRSTLSAGVSISIENLLPKLIGTMILIQMSFAISGFLIDGMYVVSALLIGIFGPVVFPKAELTTLIQQYLFSGPEGILQALIGPGGFWKGLFTVLFEIPDSLLNIFGDEVRLVINAVLWVVGYKYVAATLATGSIKEVLGVVLNPVLGFLELLTVVAETVAGAVAGATATVPTGPGALVGAIVGGLGAGTTALASAISWRAFIIFMQTYGFLFLLIFFPAIIFGVVLLAAIVYAAWKILIMLFMAYIRIILYVVFAPVLLVLDVFPGKSGFKPWIRALMGELAVFPIFIVFSMLSFLILSYESTGIGLRLPYLIGVEPQSFSYLIGIALLAMSPGMIDKIRKSVFGNGIDLAGDAQKALMQGLPWLLKMPLIGKPFPIFGPGLNKLKDIKDGKYEKIQAEQRLLRDIRDVLGPTPPTTPP